MKKPVVQNVIFIMLDTLGFNYLGCYGNKWIQTPNIDKFARNATLFENAYTEGLPTIPCRRAMMTGRYTLPFKGWGPLEHDDTTVADILWGQDIETALVFDSPPMRLPKYGYTRGFDYVKFCHGHELDQAIFKDRPLDPAFDPEDYVTENMIKDKDGNYREGAYMGKNLLNTIIPVLKHRQDWKGDHESFIACVTDEATRWIKDIRNPRHRFFLWLDSFDPHEPWDPPSIWEKRPCPYNPDYTGNPIVQAPMADVEGYMTEEECQHVRALYAEKVTVVDKYIGKLFDYLKESGLWEETMVILTSDHGQPMGMGEHGHGIMRKSRPWPYEELAHVPLIIHVPGTKPGQRIKAFTQSCDIAPTVLDAFGLYQNQELRSSFHRAMVTYSDEDMQGFSLLPLVYGEVDKVRDFAIAGYYGHSWSLITDEYSYIHWLSEANKEEAKGPTGWISKGKAETTDDMWTCTPGAEVILPDEDELYDRKKDPFQLNNIIHEQPEKAKELLQQLKLYIGELRTT